MTLFQLFKNFYTFFMQKQLDILSFGGKWGRFCRKMIKTSFLSFVWPPPLPPPSPQFFSIILVVFIAEVAAGLVVLAYSSLVSSSTSPPPLSSPPSPTALHSIFFCLLMLPVTLSPSRPTFWILSPCKFSITAAAIIELRALCSPHYIRLLNDSGTA